MKILKLSSYYYPEKISSSHLTEDIEEESIKAGYEIVVICPRPTRGISNEVYEKYKNIYYEEKYNQKVKIYRFKMFRESKSILKRAIRYILISIIQYKKALKQKDIDIIVGGSTPPTQGLLCALIKNKLSKKYRKKVRFIYSLQDVFPDSLETTKICKKNSIIYKIGTKIMNYTYKNADKIVVISNDIYENIIKKGVPKEKVILIRNWVDTKKVKPISENNNKLLKELNLSPKKSYIVYAGNLGKAQGIRTIIETAKLLIDNKNIMFLIFGEGTEKDKIQKYIEQLKLTNIKLFPLMPSSRISEVYSIGKFCIVTCKKGSGKNAFPSKTSAILSTGTPIIASFDLESELCRFIENNNCGYIVEPENATMLSKIILENIKKDDYMTKKKSARKCAINNFDKEKNVKKYIDLYNSLIKEV